MNKKIIYVDMDGVISDFDKAAKEGGWTHRPDLKVNFRDLELIPGAQDALLRLNQDFDIFIATTPPWTRPKVWGEKRQTHQGLSLKYLQEGFGAIKDIKILQRSKELIKNFTENNKIINLSEFKHNFVDSLPRLWLEWLVIIGFVFWYLLFVFV